MTSAEREIRRRVRREISRCAPGAGAEFDRTAKSGVIILRANDRSLRVYYPLAVPASGVSAIVGRVRKSLADLGAVPGEITPAPAKPRKPRKPRAARTIEQRLADLERRVEELEAAACQGVSGRKRRA